MSWFNRAIKVCFERANADEDVGPSAVSSAGDLVYQARVRANSAALNMAKIAEEREREEQQQEQQLFVVDGAKIKMGTHVGVFRVLQDGPSVQGRLSGTILDKYIANFIFDDGFSLTAILGDWQDYSCCKFQDNAVLLTKSTLSVLGKMPGNSALEKGCIRFLDPGQVSAPSEVVGNAAAPIPENSTHDFNISLEHVKTSFVPLGIPDFFGRVGNDKIKFKLKVSGKGVDRWYLKIEQNGTIIHRLSSTTAVVEILPKRKLKIKRKRYAAVEKSAEPQRAWPAGEYLISWNGFDGNRIYDSFIFTNYVGFTATVVGKAQHLKKECTTAVFKYAYDRVDWVDIKIDNLTFRIDVTLRVNFKDGGAIGLMPDSAKCGLRLGLCSPSAPSDQIPKSKRIKSKPPIEQRTHSFEQLKNLALEGLQSHWGRNWRHDVANYITLNRRKYEVFIQPVNTNERAMDELNLLYNTNNVYLRSGNPAPLPGEPMDKNGDFLLWGVICYNVGYINYELGWDYNELQDEDQIFKQTAAHEVGHQIIESFGGTEYSASHKGSSTTDEQIVKPDAPDYPLEGEIDVMRYYQNDPVISDLKRSVAAEKDVLGLLWLTKLKCF
ncbi:hypothetical protein ACL9RF_03150 [Sphingobacterium sp. Mn56C]|uniref:hypothetical protein n=1 Tax=Sphingobacterium sp. Mn56C TaxID=3395261 RepID=UPI003BE81D94